MEALLKAPGWQIFAYEVRRHWQDEVANFLESASNATDEAIAVGRVRQVIAARKAVLTALEWPQEEIRRLGEAESQRLKEQRPSLSRRGAL